MTSPAPLISVIIPHHETPSLLIECLRTIPATDDIEVIVVDDHTTEQAAQYNAVRDSPEFGHVHFVSAPSSSRGAGAARNYGLDHATGTWLVFADADDLFTPNAFNELRAATRGTAELVFFPPTSFSASQGLSQRHQHFAQLVAEYLANPSPTAALRLRYHFDAVWSKLLLRQTVERAGIRFEETRYGNDVRFAIQSAHAAREVAASAATVYAIRTTPNSLTTVRGDAAARARVDRLLGTHAYLKEQLPPREFAVIGPGVGQFRALANQYDMSVAGRMSLLGRLVTNGVVLFTLTRRFHSRAG